MKILTVRQARVGDLLKKAIAEVIQRKVKDPRIEGVTITGVEVSVDLKVSRVFFCVTDTSRKQDVLEGLQSAAGFLRHEMSRSVRLKSIPQLSFSYDESFDYGTKIDTILDRLERDENQDS
ncbi:MAG: 30S ribosome-binding factor RbfA [Desulfomonilia bacterium]